MGGPTLKSCSDNHIMTTLIELTDEDIAAMLRTDEFVRPGLKQPPGGVDDPEVLSHVRQLAAKLRLDGYSSGHWMMIAGGEVVGLCGFKAVPTLDGEIELGYGVAASRQRLGHATAAVAAVVEATRGNAAVRAIVALTAMAKPSVPEGSRSQWISTRWQADRSRGRRRATLAKAALSQKAAVIAFAS